MREFTGSWSHRATEVMNGLSSGFGHDDHYHREAFEHTGNWLRNNERTQAWLQASESSILWLTGSPGLGKSVVSRDIAIRKEHWWTEQTSTIRHTTTAYYYFREGFAARQTAIGAVNALLYQLFDGVPLDTLIHKMWRREGSRRCNSLPNNFSNQWAGFENCVSDDRTEQLVCVLDAVDECEPSERALLLRSLADLYSKLTSREKCETKSIVKFLITSRSLHGDLQREFEGLREAAQSEVIWLIDIDQMAHLIQLEMDPIIQESVDLFEGERRLQVEKVLRGNNQKTWLWLRTAVGSLLKTREAEKKEHSHGVTLDILLSDFPASLEGVYQETLRIASATWGTPMVERLLHIIMAARRPLSGQEILLAFKFSETDPIKAMRTTEKFHYKDLVAQQREKLKDLENLAKYLDSVVLRRVKKDFDVIHKSAREFLLETKHNPIVPSSTESIPSWKGRVNMPVANAMLTQACFSFLWTLRKYHKCSEHRMRLEEAQSPFLLYAAKHWPVHFNLQPESAAEATLASAHALCIGDGPKQNNWLNLYGFPRSVSSTYISLAIYLGLPYLVQDALNRPLSPVDKNENHSKIDPSNRHERNGKGLCPLAVAADRGYLDLLQTLFRNGFTLQRDNCVCRYSLDEAARAGNTELVKILLNNGADINDNSAHSPLGAACAEGHLEIVRFFLDRGVDDNALQGTTVTNPLRAAAGGGYTEIVKLLLARGADPNSVGHFHRTPLQAAASSGHTDIVQALLNYGANANLWPDGRSPNILEEVAEENHVEVMRTLLDHGVHWRLYGIKALWRACSHGNEEIVRMFLEKGLTPNVTMDPCSGSALNVAVRSGHHEIVQMLIKHGARVFEGDIKSALARDHGKIAEMLLKPYISLLLCCDWKEK